MSRQTRELDIKEMCEEREQTVEIRGQKLREEKENSLEEGGLAFDTKFRPQSAAAHTQLLIACLLPTAPSSPMPAHPLTP